MTDTAHYSVLLQESVDALLWNPDGCYIDATFGRGGHSRAILDRLSERGRLIAFDKDPQAIKVAQSLEKQDVRFSIVHRSFRFVADELSVKGQLVDGILFDLGVSSPQLDQAERGFSFLKDGPLDMRMNTDEGQSAEQWLAQASEQEMTRVFREYGEERFAKRIAKAIVEQREDQAISTTLQLANLIESSVPKLEQHKDPATRVFQAIRIEINQELEDLRLALEALPSLLVDDGRAVVISFHSLEDRMVKRFFKQQSRSQEFPPGLPVTHDQLKAPLSIVGKMLKASEQEVSMNTRSRSAVMRVVRKNK